MQGFFLEKWYLDVVDDDGDTCIAYAARLSFGALGVDYSSVLVCDAAGDVRARTSLKRLEAPRVEDGAITWAAARRALGFAGTWRPRDAPIVETLLDDEDGRVTWACLAPRADVEVTIDARRVAGLGYAEHLTLTIPPWRLPIRSLRWGRALADRDALVWIDWRGDGHTRSIAWRPGGARIEAFAVDDAGVRAGDGRTIVSFRDARVLRRGAIGSTALSVLGGDLLARFPGRAAMLEEQKWRARADFDGGDSGWAIHELVQWP